MRNRTVKPSHLDFIDRFFVCIGKEPGNDSTDMLQVKTRICKPCRPYPKFIFREIDQEGPEANVPVEYYIS